jgi:hypothetical protein
MAPKKKVKTERNDAVGAVDAPASFCEAVIEAAIEAKRKRKRIEEFEHHKLAEEIQRIWQKERSYFMAQVSSQGYTNYDFDIELRYFEFVPSTDQIAEALPSELAQLYKPNADVRYGMNPSGVVTLKQMTSNVSPIGRKWNVTISFEEPVMRQWRLLH